MNNSYLYLLSIIQLFVVSIHSTTSVLSDETGLKSLKGNIVCIEVGKTGTIEPKENFTACDGPLVFIGMDKKIYALTGEENEINRLTEEPKNRTGYFPPVKIMGGVEGHPRSRILYMNGKTREKSINADRYTIKGTIICLIPDYYNANVKPVVPKVPCNDYEPHIHLIYNNAGQIYVLHGTEDRIGEIERSSKRKNVTLEGIIEGNNEGWILVLN